MKIIDWYILKRYLVTFTVMLLLFVPIGIVIDVSEKVNKMIDKQAPLLEILQYYLDFTIYFANMLFPIFLFISIIWFTSKLANNTEIVAILSSGISFNRFLRPYFIGATLVSLMAMFMAFYLVPKASAGYNDFRYKYLTRSEARESQNVYRQISANEFIYVSSFSSTTKTGFNFMMEEMDGNKLKTKITAERIVWDPEAEVYMLHKYAKREVGAEGDEIERADKKELKLDFDLDDLTPVVYAAETMPLQQLRNFIAKEQARGSSNINIYLVVLYKKYSVPVSAFILTIIAVSVSSMKRRGGMGINLAIGISLAFIYVFFDKVFSVLGEASSIPPIVAVWIPNVVFAILGLFLLRNARR
ncbi:MULTISPECIES: LptF/LptG family permease [Myroides]|uniref:LptF/LptG family permease n=1 Tax=Myroides albus TaxID=2562892 RepID=A0A6I3LPD8_9FLAO|nr:MULTISPECIES: LptF/LptG family permease [Myroides]MTG98002.1 LptF/LptG family permease [Myroides albus]MVX34849.1 LptF/LptG family permease [Myroides sp. LoEW2-1]UVD80293.1 LptF/LptG family permease [Myroides albus]